MSESREAPYSHISEPPAETEEATLPLFRRARRSTVSPAFRALLVGALVLLALALLTLAVTLLVSAAATGGGGGGGGGDYPDRGKKCSAYPAFNLTNRRPDPSIVPPAPLTFDVNHTYDSSTQHPAISVCGYVTRSLTNTLCLCETVRCRYVHLVLLDHLQLSASNVSASIDHYFRFVVPQILYTAEMLRHRLGDGHNGSLNLHMAASLLTLYLACPSSDAAFYCPSAVEQQQLVDAIAQGDVTFDALPHTVESQLLDAAMAEYALRWTEQLANETGRVGGKPRSVVLTDVQGMTRGLVPVLNKTGVEAILLSTDDRVARMKVPRVFEWRDESSNRSTLVLYQHGLSTGLNASDAFVVDNFNHVLLLSRFIDTTTSTFAPHVIARQLEHVQSQYLNATVVLSTLDTFVSQLCHHGQLQRIELPVVTAELGSSSVVGAAGDPLLLAGYLNLQSLRSACIADSKCDNCSRAFSDFTQLLLTAAHPIQGANVSVELEAAQHGPPIGLYWKWNNCAFNAVRDTLQYRQLASSWNDSRLWSITGSLHALPANHSIPSTFRSLLNHTLLPPSTVNLTGLSPSKLLAGFDTGSYLISFATDGSVVSLIDKTTSVNYAGSGYSLGLFVYSFYTESMLNTSLSTYLSCTSNGSLAACPQSTLIAYSKLGLDQSFKPPNWLLNRTSYVHTDFFVQSGTDHPTVFLFNLSLPTNLTTLHTSVGAPQRVELRYELVNHTLQLTLTMYHKTATRIAESSTLLFHPRPLNQSSVLQVEQLGSWLNRSALNTAVNGTLSPYAAQRVRVPKYWQLDSLDAGVMSDSADVRVRLRQEDEATDEVQLAAVVHSNVWSREHAQVRAGWTGQCLRPQC